MACDTAGVGVYSSSCDNITVTLFAARTSSALAHAGSDSWYFGIDDFGLYSIVTAATSPTLNTSVANHQLTISWPVSVTGFTLEQSDNLTSPAWTAVNGVVNNSVTVPISVGNKFYRARQ